MCHFHSTLAFLLAGLAVSAAPLQAQPEAAPGPAESRFLIFIGGTQVGAEQVKVTKEPDGRIISSSTRIGPPLNLNLPRLQVRYDQEWRPVSLVIQGTAEERLFMVQTTFAGGIATNELTQGDQQAVRTHEVSATTVVLPNQFYGAYEALTPRLHGLPAGAELRIYVAPQAEIAARLDETTEERIRVGRQSIAARRHALTFMNPGGELPVEVWADEDQRLLRVTLPSAGLDVLRQDIATVAARQETLRHPGDQDITIPAAGFNLAATITRPPGPEVERRPTRRPAVVLVPGTGSYDRDQTIAGIPIFAQIAGALADAGYIVVRYDKRGVGQSGGRTETATLNDFAEDIRAVVRHLTRQRDVDRNRIALAGHSEGAWTALLAAAAERRVATVMLLAAASTTGAELILEQQRMALDRMQIPDEERQEKIELQKAIHEAVLSGAGWDEVPPEFRRQADTPWFQSFLTFDPARASSRVRQPVLILHGQLDRQVPVHHAERLAELLRARRRPARVEVVTMDRVNHLLVRAETGHIEEYPRLQESTVSPQVTASLVEWLNSIFVTHTTASSPHETARLGDLPS
jgi:uncharacterized protein